MSSPKLYATLLLWMLAELFERLPEVGDPEKPKLVFFFDEAHLLFADAPKALLEKIEQVVRLIRSKGVGVYFVTQNPLDIPGHRARPAWQSRAARAARVHAARSESREGRGGNDAAEPEVFGRASHHRARCRRGARFVARREGQARRHGARTDRAAGESLGPLPDAERARVIAASPIAGFYEQAVDRESAYEKLKGRAEATAPTQPVRNAGRGPPQRESPPQPEQRNDGGSLASDILFGRRGPRAVGRRRGSSRRWRRARRVQWVPKRGER